MTFFRLAFIETGKIEYFCLIWEIYARYVNKIADSSQLILSLTLIAQIACWQFDTWIHILEQKAFFGLLSVGRKIWER